MIVDKKSEESFYVVGTYVIFLCYNLYNMIRGAITVYKLCCSMEQINNAISHHIVFFVIVYCVKSFNLPFAVCEGGA